MSEWTAETAEWYAERYGEYATNRLAADATEVAPDAVVVDVGCGTGSALRRIAPRVPDGMLIGLDPIPRMLEIARERASEDPNGHRIQFREAPAERLPLEDASADLVFAFDSIDHWQDKAAGLREIRRVLRPNGRLVVVKDGGLPGGAKAQLHFLAALRRSGLKVLLESVAEARQIALRLARLAGNEEHAMHVDIEKYNTVQSTATREICSALATAIDAGLKGAESKIWHRAPVWFIDGNPIVGYWVRKAHVQLLFWSGQSFEEPLLQPEGKFKAAELRITDAAQIKSRDLKRWLRKARAIQWDYKNIVKRRGALEKIGNW